MSRKGRSVLAREQRHGELIGCEIDPESGVRFVSIYDGPEPDLIDRDIFNRCAHSVFESVPIYEAL